MNEPTPAEGLNELETLIYPDLYTYIDPGSRPAQVGWGVFFTIARQIEAVLTLHSRRLCFAVGPNRRVIVEYILYLMWLADDGEAAVDVLNRSLQNNQKLMTTRLKLDELFERFPDSTRHTVTETIETPLAPHPDELVLKPGNLIKKYAPALQSYYAAESGFSHVSMTSIQFFMKASGDDVALSQSPVPEESMACVDFCLHLFAHALTAFNKLLIGQPWTEGLSRIFQKYGIKSD